MSKISRRHFVEGTGAGSVAAAVIPLKAQQGSAAHTGADPAARGLCEVCRTARVMLGGVKVEAELAAKGGAAAIEGVQHGGEESVQAYREADADLACLGMK
jgi:hypothetical protein